MIAHSIHATASQERLSRARGYIRFAMILEYLQRRRTPATFAQIHEYATDEIGDFSERTTYRDLQFLTAIGAVKKCGRDRQGANLWQAGEFSQELRLQCERAVDLQAELSEIDMSLQSQFRKPERWTVTDINYSPEK